MVIGVIVAMFLFPPFNITRGYGAYYNGGYHFIFDPPQSGILTGYVNTSLLLVQWVMVLIIGALAFFMAKGTKTVIQPQEPIKDNVIQEPFYKESKDEDSHKTEVTEKQFKRFKISTVLLYLIFSSGYLILFLEKGNLNSNSILTMIWAVCFTLTVGMFWVYLGKCAKIVHKRPLHYIALIIFIPFIGAALAYTRLKTAYDTPFSTTW